MRNTADIRSLFGHVLDWIYPPACVHCGKKGALICGDCLSKLPEVGDHYCSHCGKPLKPKHFCRHCAKSEFLFQSSRAPYLYEGPVPDMIQKLKYKKMLDLVPILAKLLTDFWPELNWQIDMVVPVPLAKQRRTRRGFNQSEKIAADFTRNTGLPHEPRALMKQRETAQQVGLDAAQRRLNLSGAFAAEPSLVRGKRILLLDDVMTTGSTFAECSAVLLEAGAKSVKCLSVATTRIDHGNLKR